MWGRVLLLASAILALAFAPAPFPRSDPNAYDLKRLGGVWFRVSVAYGGVAQSPGTDRLAFSGRKLRMTIAGRTSAYGIKLDATARPKALDLRRKRDGMLFRAIYELKGNTLTLCYDLSSSDAHRPRDFHSKGPFLCLEIYSRKKSR
jgi:uncharacterized protein (TIGR03067 family)